MKKLIPIALFMTRAFRVLLFVFAGLYLAFLILELSGSHLTNQYVFDIPKSPDSFSIYECADCVTSKNLIRVEDVSTPMLLWLSFKLLALLSILILICNEVLKVLNNFNDVKTFYEDNIKSFRKMGQLGLVIAVLMAFNYFGYWDAQQEIDVQSFSVRIPFAELAFALACFVLAEVFAEGNRLKLDSESIL